MTTGDASEPVRARRGYAGFAVGVRIAIAATAIHFALRGWRDLEDTIVASFGLFPGIVSYIEWGRASGTGGTAHRWPIRFRTKTLMFLVAYVAFVLALGVLTFPLSRSASTYHGKYTYSRTVARSLRETAFESEHAGSVNKHNAKELRIGKIPEKLDQSQKDFLLSIDQMPISEDRKQLYSVTADGEEQLAALHMQNVTAINRLVEYHEAIARKYKAAAARPWMTVQPDPPEPSPGLGGEDQQKD
jgi:hypothetical protein